MQIKKIKLTYILLFLMISLPAFSQVENLTVRHPVYDYLRMLENKGILEYASLSDIPFSRGEITDFLIVARENITKLNSLEISSLEEFEKEFGISSVDNAVIIHSESDSNGIFFSRLLSDNEKYIYHYQDSGSAVSIIPLAEIDYKHEFSENTDRYYLTGSIGGRVYGTIFEHVGYNLQVTNGSLFGGDRALAVEDPKYGKNIKFAVLNSDVDITESHVNIKYDWFEAGIGREVRLMGAGLDQNLFISDRAPVFDAVTLGAKFKNFEYKFLHGSLLALPEGNSGASGFNVFIPSKYVAMHRFAVKLRNSEFAFWENVVYSDREADLAYLNPLSFYKSLEHSLRDRDNSVLGLDGTMRFFDKMQIKASFLLDDIIFDRIGSGFWSNKTAWNIALLSDIAYGISAGIEYTRVEPYTYTHFNRQNSMTHDGMLYGSDILPNSERYTGLLSWWWGARYPLKLNISYTRHGENVYDGEGNLIKNVGGDPLQTRRPDDPENVIFLDGKLQEIFIAELEAGFEIVRGFNIHAVVSMREVNGSSDFGVKTLFRIYDF